MAQFKVNENILVDVEHWRTDAIDNWFDTAATDEMVHIDTALVTKYVRNQ